MQHDDTGRREFVCKKFVLNPQLNSIRHTPSIDTVLEWLRVRNSRQFIPYHVHVLFTDPLESMLTSALLARRHCFFIHINAFVAMYNASVSVEKTVQRLIVGGRADEVALAHGSDDDESSDDVFHDV